MFIIKTDMFKNRKQFLRFFLEKKEEERINVLVVQNTKLLRNFLNTYIALL